MARINLLPWRAERRKQREREFYMMLVATAVAAILVFFCVSYWMGMRIDNQNQRNDYLSAQIKLLDKDIETIKNLEKVRSQLLARKEIIEDLQSNRSQMVHLFDQLSRTIPDGTRLTSLKQTGDKLTLEGVAESSTRVATYMRSLENSPYLGKADLAKIESKEGTAGVDPKMPYVFSLSVTTKKTTEAEKSAAAVDATAAGDDAGSGDKAKPTDLGAQLNNAATTLTSKKAPAEEKKP
ncbi:MAG TPA: PilN domain-containing protein [Dokdonella sp.]|uniref:PilN domain-containing protein n=1 Tax=Dokdonella sp. TaxID=2291710 RepID=UPI002D7E79A1|nr:PilN domain-containing protein [Dokdonella sp.]HET9034153.1 PilN domain-containing protein [Dokdonella sp.]